MADQPLTADDQALIDIRLLLFDQGDQLAALTNALLRLNDLVSSGLMISNLAELPAPIVEGRKVNVTFDESKMVSQISAALTNMTARVEQDRAALTSAIEQLIVKFGDRPQSVTPVSGPGRVSLIDSAGNLAGTSTNPVFTSSSATGSSAQEKRLDYVARTDSNPVYVGIADSGTPEGNASWTVLTLTYDASVRLTSVAARTGIAWTAR